MYQALYRKYRPKNFEEVIGQEIVVKTLKNSINNNKINHAYLFAGPRGTGKTSLAKIFAKIVNCENPIELKPCNKCVCCTQKNEQNLDIIEMDAASNNGVDEIREIRNKVSLVPSLGKFKIYIIDEVHMLTIGAFNALLKTLEEPPSHVIFILATTDPHKVPVTILSRCQRFDLKKISEEQIYSRLKYICKEENIKIEENALKEISRLGDGCMRDSISILEQAISYSDSEITLNDIHEVNGTVSQEDISKLIINVIENNIISVIEQITKYNNCGKSLIKLTEEIIIFLRNAILFKMDESYFENPYVYEFVSENTKIDDLIEFINIFNECLVEMKKGINSKIILELSLIKIINNINKIKKIDMPIKIEELEEKQIISPEIKKSDIENIDLETTKKIEEFIRIRVNNTLSKFSKAKTLELKKQLLNVNDYIMDDNYDELATLILDGELKAASDENMIFVYKTSNLSYNFNEKIKKIESFFYKIFNIQYKIVAVDIEYWEQIKEKFNNKKEKFIYQQETIDINDILNKKTNEDNIKSLFGEIVEYN